MILRKMKITEQLIVDYIDGALSAEQSQFVLDQINQDSDLMASYLSYKEADSLLQSIPVVKPSSAFSENIMLAIQQEQKTKHAPTSFGVFYLIPAAMVLLSIIALIFQPSSAWEGGSSLVKYFPTLELSNYKVNLTIDNPLFSTFKNYSYVLILACAMILIDTVFKGRRTVVPVL